MCCLRPNCTNDRSFSSFRRRRRLSLFSAAVFVSVSVSVSRKGAGPECEQLVAEEASTLVSSSAKAKAKVCRMNDCPAGSHVKLVSHDFFQKLDGGGGQNRKAQQAISTRNEKKKRKAEREKKKRGKGKEEERERGRGSVRE